ncbi:hypothetical protein [Streptomyces hypolithicus]
MLPRPVTLHTLMQRTGDTRTARCSPQRLRIDTARTAIRHSRSEAVAVHVYETTDRDGNGVHVAYAHFAPGRFDCVDSETDIYEIPTNALTDL